MYRLVGYISNVCLAWQKLNWWFFVSIFILRISDRLRWSFIISARGYPEGFQDNLINYRWRHVYNLTNRFTPQHTSYTIYDNQYIHISRESTQSTTDYNTADWVVQLCQMRLEHSHVMRVGLDLEGKGYLSCVISKPYLNSRPQNDSRHGQWIRVKLRHVSSTQENQFFWLSWNSN